MTINSDVRVAGPFIATGVAQVLPFTFRIFTVNDVVVYVSDLVGGETKLTNQSGFSVSMNADQNVSPGGTVTITSTLNYTLTLTTELANTQPAQFPNGGAFYSTVVNDALDRLTVLIQQAVNAAARSLKFPVSDGSVNTTLPNKIARANKVLGFDANGDVTVSSTDVNNVVQSAANAAAAQAAQIAAQNAQAAAEAAASGVKWKNSVRAATTGALPACTYANGASGVGATLTGNVNGALAAQDGITLVATDRLLVKTQAAPAQNGIYVVTQVGTGGTPFILTRATDIDQWAEVPSAATTVEEGSTLADSIYICTANQGGTMGTTAITWQDFSFFVPANSLGSNKLTAQALIDIRQIPQNSKSADYTLALTDGGGHVYHPPSDANNRTFTIPANASVAFPIGTAITIDNDAAANTVAVAITTDTLVQVGTGATGTRTIAAQGQATILKVAATRWRISGVGLT